MINNDDSTQSDDSTQNDDSTQEEQASKLGADAQELQESTRRFVRSLVRTGLSLSLIPINMLPDTSRGHFQSAGREFTLGLSKLVREVADGMEKIAREP